jgi:predicted SnoaL-like aldol condensation-catalyzing enzyme
MHNIWRNAEPFGAPEMVSFDIIRVDENGKVAEHWDALQPLGDGNGQRQKQTDGPTEVTDLDQTEANKALAVALIEDVLMGRDPARITDYISAESYAQHNPDHRGRA